MRIRSEDGFTVAEVVIAAAIMFVVLTAIIGLMGSSTQMTVQAKQKTTLVNQVSSVIDEIRSASFTDIDSWAGERTYYPDGVNGLVVVVDTTIETKLDKGKPYLKVVTINALGTFQDDTFHYDTRVSIRNPEFGSTMASDPDAPQVEFLDGTPPADEILVGSQRYGSDGSGSKGSINIYTRAYGPADPLALVKYEIAGAPMTSNSGGAGVVFTPDTNPFLAPSTTWNTAQTTVVDGSTVLKYADGFQTISVTAEDASHRTATARRRFILDNREADAPGIPYAIPLNSCSMVLGWAAARDGGTGADSIGWYWASRYEYSVYREPLSGGTSDITTWPRALVDYKVAGNTIAQAIQNRGPFTVRTAVAATSTPALSRVNLPFSRYFVRIRSGGPTGIGNAASTSANAIITPPELICDSSAQSSVTVGAKLLGTYRHTVNFYVTSPNFPCSTPSDLRQMYTVQYKTVDGSLPNTWTALAGTKTVTQRDGHVFISEVRGLAKNTPYDWRVLVTGVTPNGHLGGTALPAMPTNTGRMADATIGVPRYLNAVWE